VGPIFYSDENPYTQAVFRIPAEKWAEFEASQQYKDMAAYTKELQEEWGATHCDNEKMWRMAKAREEERKIMALRINKMRNLAACALVIAIAAVAIAILR